MPRRFSAPIPIWREFRPDPRDPYVSVESEIGTWRYLALKAAEGEAAAAELANLYRTNPALWDEVWVDQSERIRAVEIIENIFEIEKVARIVVLSSADALTIDDLFQVFIHPQFDQDMIGFFRQLREVELNNWAGLDELRVRIIDWLKHWASRHYPGLRKATVGNSLANPEGNPPCWHGRGHKDFVHPGRKWKPERRAATWGTYILAWIVGSETLAVRLWNLLPWPAGYRWSEGKRPTVALKKYTEAKNRLVADLRRKGLLQVRNDLKPYPPLSPAVAAHIEAHLISLEVEDDMEKAVLPTALPASVAG